MHDCTGLICTGIFTVLFLQVYLLSQAEGGRANPLTENFRPQVFCQTWDYPAHIRLKGDRQMVMPGEDATIELVIRAKMVRFSFLRPKINLHLLITFLLIYDIIILSISVTVKLLHMSYY